MKKFAVLIGAATVAFAAVPANAVNIPVPTNAYITQGGLDWAWGAPLPDSSFANPLSYQGTLGWRLPTAAELASAPLATAFIFVGANVPLGGADANGASFQATNANLTGAAACAAAYFASGYSHCDWQDGLGQPYGPWAGMQGSDSYADQLYVRAAVGGAVPEPASWAMMIGGFGLAGAAMRGSRKRKLALA